jgi:hypothetical protein
MRKDHGDDRGGLDVVDGMQSTALRARPHAHDL